MNADRLRSWQFPRHILCAAGGLALLAALAGCANPVHGGLSADPVTASDEAPARQRARLRLELAVGYFEEGRTEIALDELKQVLGTDPDYAAAYNLRGLIYMRLQQPRLAQESFRRALELSPADADLLHNYGWLLCQQGQYAQGEALFQRALALPAYGARAKTLMTQGLCQIRAGQPAQAEASLLRAYELDASHPVTGYNLASLMLQRGELTRARFYIRRLNNSESANAESLWLGIRIEQGLGDQVAMNQLAEQLRKRYPQSRELAAFDRGAFHE